MTVHSLKTWPVYFVKLQLGHKTHEVRKDDRNPRFAVGDLLVLMEWNPSTSAYTGRSLARFVTSVDYLSEIGIEGYVGMSVVPTEDLEEHLKDELDRQATEVVMELLATPALPTAGAVSGSR